MLKFVKEGTILMRLNTELILKYSDIFQGNIPNFETEIKKINIYKLISIICELISLRNSEIKSSFANIEISVNYEVILKMILLDFDPNEAKNSEYKEIIFDKKQHIISLQTALILIKKALNYCVNNSSNIEDFEVTLNDYKFVMNLFLILSEELDDKMESNDVDVNHFIYCNYHLNNGETIAYMFLRSYFIFEKMLKDKSNFDGDIQPQFKEYFNDFMKKYGYTPTEYLFVLFSELLKYTSDLQISKTSLWRNVGDFVKKTHLFDIDKKVIFDLGLSIQSYSEWAKDAHNNEWDFSKFLEYPFIISESGKYISISDYTLKNCFFEKLYWQVRACYPKDDDRAMDFYGRPFEKYIQKLTSSAIVDRSGLNFINEFKFGNNNRSSDAYIERNNELIVIECKGISILLPTITLNRRIDDNNNKLFIEPVLQADECFYKLKNEFNEFENIDIVYIISVAMNNINAIPEYTKNILTCIKSEKKSVEAKYFYNMSIEEYERFMVLAENNYDIFKILKSYSQVQEHIPFTSFISEKFNSCENKMTNFMKDIYDEATNHMKSRYGF